MASSPGSATGTRWATSCAASALASANWRSRDAVRHSGNGHDAALVTLGLVDIEAPAVQVDVFQSEIERLADAQATGVDQMNEQASRIPVSVGHLGQELQDFIASRTMP